MASGFFALAQKQQKGFPRGEAGKNRLAEEIFD